MANLSSHESSTQDFRHHTCWNSVAHHCRLRDEREPGPQRSSHRRASHYRNPKPSADTNSYSHAHADANTNTNTNSDTDTDTDTDTGCCDTRL